MVQLKGRHELATTADQNIPKKKLTYKKENKTYQNILILFIFLKKYAVEDIIQVQCLSEFSYFCNM